MRNVYQGNDLTVVVRFRNTVGEPIPVPRSVVLSYTTPLSTPLSATYQGKDTQQCRRIENGMALELFFPKITLNTGQMTSKRTYTVASSQVSGAEQQYTHSDILAIRVADPLDPESCPCAAPTQNGNPIQFEDYVLMPVGPQGAKGNPGDGVDYSLQKEIPLPGEFALTPNGEQRPVFSRTILVHYPSGYGTGIIFQGSTLTPPMLGLGGFVAVDGFCYIYPLGDYPSRFTTFANEQISPFIFSNLGNYTFSFYTEKPTTEPRKIIVRVKYFYQ